MHVERGFTPFVVFDESAVGVGLRNYPVRDILQSLHDLAAKIILPAFEQFLQSP